MPLPRFEKLSEEKQDRILDAAAREFAVNGYEKASLNLILERAGISKGAAYYYFEDKADLIATVIHKYWIQSLSTMSEIVSHVTAEDFWQKITDLYMHPFVDLEEHPWMLGFARAVWTLPHETLESGPVKAVFGEAMDWLRDLVHSGRELGVIRDDLPEELVMELMMALDSVHDTWLGARWQEMTREEREGFTLSFTRLMRRLLEKD